MCSSDLWAHGLLGPGCGDNAGAALGVDAGNDVVVSLGTSGTAFVRSEVCARDTSGSVAGFADATGAFLPLVCTLNAARVLDSVAMMLGVEPDIEVVGEAGDGAEAVERAAELRPDLVLMDVQMPGMDGIAATREIVRQGLGQVVVLTTFDREIGRAHV